jgi:flagellar biosynthesis/type III secretory pathway protein FliH
MGSDGAAIKEALKMDYNDLVKEIKKKADTQIPALMIVCVRECIRREIFVSSDGLLRVVKNAIRDESEKETKQ